MSRHNCAAAVGAILLIVVAVSASPTTARAQHSDWLLGSNGLLSGQQAPEGFHYSNVWSYYNASGSDFIQGNPLACRPFGNQCVRLALNTGGSLDLFVDQNVFIWTSPYKILGANYGALVDVPFAIADASGAASLEPIPISRRPPLLTGQTSGSSTKGSIANIYVQPIDLGWHFRQADAIVSSGFFAPSGPYNSDSSLNIGFGHWTGVFGIGGVVYADRERSWSLSVYSHYLLYGSQMARNYTLGDVVPFEWGTGKTLDLGGNVLQQLTLGAVGYAQWQVAGASIDVTPTTQAGRQLVNALENSRSEIYAAGPGFNLLTKYGLFSLRYYEEFGANATPSGRQLMLSVAF